MPHYFGIASEILDALSKMGGRAPLWHISYEIRKNRRERGADVPDTIDITVRRILEERCAKSRFYQGVSDLFAMTEDDANGTWTINHAEAERQRRLTYYPRAY
jgi:hypothetical protein